MDKEQSIQHLINFNSIYFSFSALIDNKIMKLFGDVTRKNT